MVLTVLEIVAPVFLVIVIGYVSVYLNVIDGTIGKGITKFAQQIALPCLLFINISEIELSEESPTGMLLSFYIGATVCMFLGTSAAYFIFKLSAEDSVVLGFCALFSNALLLGLPITSRAFGENNLFGNYSIIAIHAPFCYLLGITMMELAAVEKNSSYEITRKILKNIISNALFIGISVGLLFNFTDLQLPIYLEEPVKVLSSAAIPTALFGLGVVLYQYKFSNHFKEITLIASIALMVHPLLVYLLATNIFEVSVDNLKSAVITAAMAPGVNAYLFSVLYRRESSLIASTVLFSTIFAVFTSSAWLIFLGAA